MAILPIYNCFHPILRKKTDRVENFDGKLKILLDNMFKSMYYSEGVGLAANQVGVLNSIVIIHPNSGDNSKKQYKPLAMINPLIEAFSDDNSTFQEGCLSIPKFFEDVVRPKFIQVKYTDVNMKEISLETDEILSRIIQHEVDHLNGILFIDRLSILKKTLAKSKLKRIQRGDVDADYSMVQPDGKLFVPDNHKRGAGNSRLQNEK